MDSPDRNILAIDTSTRVLQLAVIFGGDRLVKGEEQVDKSHGQIIIKRIADLIDSTGLDKRELDGIAVCTGPGSFTGLRIGLSAAKGMAVALNIPVVGVNVFELAAYKLRDESEPVFVIVPLRRDEFFVCRISDGHIEGGIRTVDVQELPAILGDGPVGAYGVDLTERFSGLKLRDVSARIAYEGSDLANLGMQRLLDKGGDDLAALEPLYLKKSQAEIRFDQRD